MTSPAPGSAHPRARAWTFAVIVVLALAGCGGGHHGSAASTTSSSAGPATSSAAPSPPATSSPTSSGPLTKAQIEAALPKLTDVPSGWKVDDQGTLTETMSSRDTDPVSPASCSKPSQVQENFNFVAPSTSNGHADFYGGADGPFLGVTIFGFTDPYPASAFAAMRAAIRKCPTYVESEDGGDKDRPHLAVVSTPALGDGSFGFMANTTLDGTDLRLYVLLVRSGHTLVAGEEATINQPVNRAQLEKLVETTLKRAGG